ncbi:hypothetical protein D6T63_13705 [Arthrobacter cheniae]|uniref:Uncharacterized protein n=1 Tax=Arthrobacter cheniae TaxID=1258888 RepID=A0A3A5MBN8_9MICC|nr:hypothetical protein D6T63_13705 [Arthrobacter cheniae]
MNVPMCNRCGTARFLRFTSFGQGQVDHAYRDGDLVGDRNGPVGPVIHYFCQACGTRDGHPVPEDWMSRHGASTPEDGPDIEELRQRGEVWIAPGQRSVRRIDGSWIVEAQA